MNTSQLPNQMNHALQTAGLGNPFTVRDRRLFGLFGTFAIASIALFAEWWFQPVHIPHTLLGTAGEYENVLLFLLVSYVVWHPILMQLFSWAISYQMNDTFYEPPAAGLRVALITTFVPHSESIELLHKCLPAMIAAEYPHDTWLLDEGDGADVRSLCEMLGVKHYSRSGVERHNTTGGKFSRRTKGGNHNSWYDDHGDDYDIVAQMDTDFLPEVNFLTRTLGHFKNPRVAFVGTPQIYGNTAESLVARGAAEQAYKFYGPILRGFSGMKTMLMIGANHVVRVAALKEVDHYSAHITEDLITGMKLHAKGWISVYVPEPLAIGEGPATWASFFNQQMRWAYGCFDILFRHSPRILSHMASRRAWYYFFTQQYYFSGLAMALGLLALGLYAIFGVTSVAMSVGTFLEYYVPVLLVCELMELWLQKFDIRPQMERGILLAGRLTSIATWPIFFLALVGILTGKRLAYKVTPKGVGNESPGDVSLSVFTPHFVIAAYCIVCISWAIINQHRSPIMLFWLGLSAITMLTLPFAASFEKSCRYFGRNRN